MNTLLMTYNRETRRLLSTTLHKHGWVIARAPHHRAGNNYGATVCYWAINEHEELLLGINQGTIMAFLRERGLDIAPDAKPSKHHEPSYWAMPTDFGIWIEFIPLTPESCSPYGPHYQVRTTNYMLGLVGLVGDEWGLWQELTGPRTFIAGFESPGEAGQMLLRYRLSQDTPMAEGLRKEMAPV